MLAGVAGLLLAIPPAPADPVPEGLPPLAAPTTLDRIGRVLVSATINGRGPFRLIVDTGASRSTLSARAVERLGLTPMADKLMRVNGVTGTEERPSVLLERLQAGDLVVENVQVPVVEAWVLDDADGVLGVAGLEHERIYADFQRNRVEIRHGHDRDAMRGLMRIAGRRRPDGLLSIIAWVGTVRVTAIIDTGSERTLGNLALRQALRERQPGVLSVFTEVYGATRQSTSAEVKVAPPIAIGEARISDVELVYGDFHIFEVWQLNTEPALIIGMDVLGAVPALAVDFARSELYLKESGAADLVKRTSTTFPGRGMF